nr:ATP-binding protein [Jannaschia sp. S6380]
MRDGFAVFDASGRLVAANHVYLGLFDGASGLGPGVHAQEIFAGAAEEGAFDIGDASPEAWAHAQVARWHAEIVPPQILHHYDGRILRFQDRRAPDGDVVSLVLDVTEDRTREAALIDARDAAERTARIKADFLARMSHEIRTPMNGILGMTRMLIDEGPGGEAGLLARTIHDSADALLTIVNDTLDVSRLNADRLTLREAPFDLERLLGDCLRLAGAGARPGVAVALDCPIGLPGTVRGDAGRVRQIVMNLLGNAAKFTQVGSIVLRVARVDADPTQFAITVEDTGPGIADSDRDAVFEAFGQGDLSEDTMREGTGLGLTISRGLAERMGGTLTLQPDTGSGAIFTLVLPLPSQTAGLGPDDFPRRLALSPGGGVQADLIGRQLAAAGIAVTSDVAGAAHVLLPMALPETAQRQVLAKMTPGARLVALGPGGDAAAEVMERAGAILPPPFAWADLVSAFGAERQAGAEPDDRPRILLADDNATNRLLLDRMLKDTPYQVELAAGGAEAIAAARRARPDVAVLDISMPDVDGFEVAAALQELPGPAVPILALTAHVGAEMTTRLRNAGFAAHLTKPLCKDALLEAVAAALSPASPDSVP